MGAPNGHAFGRDAGVQLREVEALRLRAEGKTLEQIAVAVGWANKSSAKRAIDRLLADVKFDAVDNYRQLMLAELEAVKARVLEIFYADHVHVADGKVVRDKGRAVFDRGPNLAAAREFRQLTERISKLIGADAPTRKVVEVLTNDVVDQAIAQELAAMEALDAGRSADREAAAAPPATS